jgi:hypothetical protein
MARERGNLPDGQITSFNQKQRQAPRRKIFNFRFSEIYVFLRASRPGKRASADRHETWGRDAMDADGTLDEAGRPWTAKSCGPDLPTLGSSLKSLQATVAKKPGTPGRTGISRKTIAQGIPDRFGVLAVTNSRTFLPSSARLRER